MRSLCGLLFGMVLAGCALEVGTEPMPLGMHAVVGQQAQESGSADESEQPFDDPQKEANSEEPPAFKDAIEGYPREERQVGTPIDVDADLARGFPKTGAILDGRLPKGYFDWKEQLYSDTGIKLAFNATLVGQWASEILDQQWLTGQDTKDVAAGWSLVLEGKWEAFNRGKDWQGGVTAAFDWRQGIGNAVVPSNFSLHTGSMWGTEFTIIEWDPWFSTFYWEQWGKKNSLVGRVGTQSALQMYDFFRFKDGRSSFTNSEFWAPAASVPFPGPGLGASFEWWPREDSPLYVVGTVNDVNFTVGESFAWDTAFKYGEFFYGLEVGYNWGQFPTNFDHLHAQVFYADESSTLASGLPNEAGGGFKVRGSKQWDQLVVFGSYTFNKAQGGPFGITLLEHAATAGVAYLRPADVRGELALGVNWGQPFDSFDEAAPVFEDLRDQYGIETYWKLLLTPDTWITPGVQYIIDPTFNTEVDSLFIATLKLHLFL